MKSYILHFKISKLIFLAFIIALLSCSGKEKNARDLWIGKKIITPEVNVQGKKIVTRFIGDCPSCIESIKTWKKFHAAAKEKNINIKIIFYVEIIKEENFKQIKQKLNFADQVIFDQRGLFFNQNLLHFPFGLEDQTFLLNENNEIVLFGNPAVDRKLITEYINNI